MKALLDTNIFLEIILSQERAEEAKSLLLKSAQHEFFITDYSLHSIGLVLFRRNQHEAFRSFLEDVLLNGGVGLLSLLPDDMTSVIASSEKFRLDFDDAYQYAVAVRYDAVLISFDTDFKRTDKGYKTPFEVLQNML
ncbi:MAG: PIN domain-containing protein [Anaerolineales bacterium]|nr:PIN domain-containing protein [Anaerolineales bacterium]